MRRSIYHPHSEKRRIISPLGDYSMVINILRPSLHGRYLAEDNFKFIFHTNPWLVQIIPWCWTGDSPLSAPIMAYVFDANIHFLTSKRTQRTLNFTFTQETLSLTSALITDISYFHVFLRIYLTLIWQNYFQEILEIYWYFLPYLNMEMPHVVEAIILDAKDKFFLHNQIHGFWWPCDARRQGISSTCVDLAYP